MILKSDIRSVFKSATLYGKKGDEVRLIRDCGNVLLVEGPDGNQFPVKSDQVTEGEIEKPTIAEPTKTVKSVPSKIQQSLF